MQKLKNDATHSVLRPLSVIPSDGNADIEALSRHFAATRDDKTRDALILHYQKLVYYIASRFQSGTESLDDLVQVGNIGLINALDRYDHSKDTKFSTYAVPTIVGEIKRHFRDKTWQVKVPRWLQEKSLQVQKAQQNLTSRLGRGPSIHEIAQELEITEEEALEALEIGRTSNALSLDTRLDRQAGADSTTLLEHVGRPDSALHAIELYIDIQRALERLDGREREIIQKRFFDEIPQSHIAAEMCLSQMHVSRLQQRALTRLRAMLADETGHPVRRTRTPALSAASRASK